MASQAAVVRPVVRRVFAGDRDVYMDKARSAEDPTIRKAMQRMVRAARDARSAKSEMFLALGELERHPDYNKTERARRNRGALSTSITLAWWVHNCIHGALYDAMLEDVGDWLLEDANPARAAATLRQFQVTEKRDLARFARKAQRRRVS